MLQGKVEDSSSSGRGVVCGGCNSSGAVGGVVAPGGFSTASSVALTLVRNPMWWTCQTSCLRTVSIWVCFTRSHSGDFCDDELVEVP